MSQTVKITYHDEAGCMRVAGHVEVVEGLRYVSFCTEPMLTNFFIGEIYADDSNMSYKVFDIKVMKDPDTGYTYLAIVADSKEEAYRIARR